MVMPQVKLTFRIIIFYGPYFELMQGFFCFSRLLRPCLPLCDYADSYIAKDAFSFDPEVHYFLTICHIGMAIGVPPSRTSPR